MNKPGTKCFKVPELDEIKRIQWDDEISEKMHTCLLGETVASANEDSVKQEGYVCKDKQLFKELREPPPGVGVIGIGSTSKPAGLGTIVFKREIRTAWGIPYALRPDGFADLEASLTQVQTYVSTTGKPTRI
eukprot:12240681-Ditylum_brightwellii.AAC.1